MTALLIVAVLVLVLVNGFFVAAEFALVRANRGRLKEQVDQNLRGATTALRQQDDLSQYLSACQFGITLASLGIGFLGEPAIATLFEPVLGGRSPTARRSRSRSRSPTCSSRAVHVIVGEQVPKIFAIVKAEDGRAALRAPARRVRARHAPVHRGAQRRGELDPAPDADRSAGGVRRAAASPEDLKFLIPQARSGGKLDPGEAGMLRGVFHLHEQEARQVMTPIPAVVTVDVSEDVETALRRCVSSPATRAWS